MIDGRAYALATTGNTGTDKVKTFRRRLAIATDCVWKKVFSRHQ